MSLQREIQIKEKELSAKKAELVNLATGRAISNPLKRKNLHTEIVKLKAEIRSLKRTLRQKEVDNAIERERIKEIIHTPTTLNKTEYIEELNIINDIYVKSTTSLRVGDKVNIMSENRVGVIHSFSIYPEAKNSGIFVKILSIKKDGDVSKKFIRKSRLDVIG